MTTKYQTCMDYSPWSERKIWPNLKGNFISETGEAMLTKIGVHAFDISLYLHEIFEPILFDYSPWSEREIWPNLKGNFISKTGEAMLLYLHKIFELILFDCIF